MVHIDSRMVSRGNRALVAFAALALCAGCAVEPATGPTYVDGANVPANVGAGPSDVDVVYVEQPPVVDIETYPSVVYEGTPVYYVGGQWYQRGPRGWGYYRQEPPVLAQQRETHERDPRWVQAREAPAAQRPVQQAPPARQAEQLAPERMARPEEPARTEQAARPAEAAQAEPARRPNEEVTPAAPKRAARPAAVKRAAPAAAERR